MPLHDKDDYTRDLLPGTVKKEHRDVIEAAIMLGWRLHITGRQSCTLVPPEGQPQTKKFHFGVSSRSQNLNRMKRDITKYADPRLLELANKITDEGAQAAFATGVLPHLGDEGTVIDSTPEADTRPTKAERERQAARQRAEELERSQGVNAPPVQDPRPERHVVDQRPLLASRGGRPGGTGSAYYSDTTIERRWSDGTVDYICAHKGCDYQSESRTSPSRHYATTHSRKEGPVPQRSSFKAEVPDRAVYNYQPRDARVEALAQIISDLMASGGRSPREIAETALKWVHEQRHTDLSADQEPLTPEEQIARIKTILDDGTMFNLDRQTREQADRIVELTARAEGAEARASEAEHRLEVTAANLRAWQELMPALTEEEAG